MKKIKIISCIFLILGIMVANNYLAFGVELAYTYDMGDDIYLVCDHVQIGEDADNTLSNIDDGCHIFIADSGGESPPPVDINVFPSWVVTINIYGYTGGIPGDSGVMPSGSDPVDDPDPDSPPTTISCTCCGSSLHFVEDCNRCDLCDCCGKYPCECTLCLICDKPISYLINGTEGCNDVCTCYKEPCDIDINLPDQTFQGVGFTQVELRAMYPVLVGGLGITSSASLGFMMDRNGGIGVYYTGSLGVSQGIGVMGGVSVGVMPTVNTIQDMRGLALNAGYMFGFNGVSRTGEINLLSSNPILSETQWDDLRLGVTTSLPVGYVGAGAGAYIDVSYTEFLYISSSTSLENMTLQINSILPIELTFNDIFNLLDMTNSNLWNFNKSLKSNCSE